MKIDMNVKKNILFVYPTMNIGGSTTSLLSILNEIDYSKYNIDLILGYNNGELFYQIPKCVNILKPYYRFQNRILRIIRIMFSPRFIIYKIMEKIRKITWQSRMISLQWFESKCIEFYNTDLDKEYDIAISFLEGVTCRYVANHVKAKRKIAWIHINYEEVGLNPIYDFDVLKVFDRIVTVSIECRNALVRQFPQFEKKILFIDNILSKRRLYEMSKEKVSININDNNINLFSSSRIVFNPKGFDRAVLQIEKLFKTNNMNISRLKWYIIGDGPDYKRLENMIKEKKLENVVFLLGAKVNPYPFFNNMSLYFQPSIYEGKPMTVTEGLILGLPALVTNYSSAIEQIQNGVDGMIVENSEVGIFSGLKYILDNPFIIKEWYKNVRSKNYSNSEVIHEIERMLDGD